MMSEYTNTSFRNQLDNELTGNILPFWMNLPVDRVSGGFHGAITNDLKIKKDVPRSAILCARILWTFSAAYRKYETEAYLSMAEYAYKYLISTFWDKQNGGFYWSVDAVGKPVQSRKHHYAQAFGIYGLTEYYRANGDRNSLIIAQDLFELLEKHAYDPIHGGYIEGSSQSWGVLKDMRLSTKEINSRKSMNTMLHILEAYTNLLRVWEDARLKTQHKALIEIFLEKIIEPHDHHFKLLFNDQWDSLVPHVSFGHDIEGSWLLVEAAEVQGDAVLISRVQESSLQMAEAVYRKGRDIDGGLFNEGEQQSIIDASKSWWGQAEGMVGFYSAYQLSHQEYFSEAAHQCWTYIQANLVDHNYGDWYKQRYPDGRLDNSVFKAGPWECPYHHSRACLEMIERLQ